MYDSDRSHFMHRHYIESRERRTAEKMIKSSEFGRPQSDGADVT